MTEARAYSQLSVALLTPPGFGGIAVLRLAGKGLEQLLGAIFTPFNNVTVSQMVTGRYYLGEIRDCEQVIDQVMLMLEHASEPESPAAEINCHGGPRIIQRLLMLLGKLGVQVVSSDLQCDLDSIETEVGFFLSRCRTELAIAAISSQFPGGLFNWCQDKINSLVNGNLSYDNYQLEVEVLLGSIKSSHRLLHPARVVLVGPPNAGKSTLANSLTGRSQSLVSAIAGTTRDWTAEFTDMAGIAIELIDTAGRRQSDDELEMLSLDRADELLKEADLLILLIPADCLTEFQELKAQQLAKLPQSCNLLTVISKADIMSVTDYDFNFDLVLSASLDQGINELRIAVREALGISSDFDFSQPLIFTPRQAALIRDSLGKDTAGVIGQLTHCIG